MILNGTVAPGYEPVRALYERNMEGLAERNTQLCIYVNDACVVDLWGSAVDDESFSADSLVNVFSSGKSLEAIALAMLADRGLLEFSAPIAEYWPEYAANDKHATTVADLMRHESGLASFSETVRPGDLHPERIRENALGAIIQRQTPMFRPGQGNQREYHAITRGWVANEVFRRIEPDGRTMGQFLRDEVSDVLGADVYIGLRDEEMQRISGVQMLGFGYQLAQSFVPKHLGRRMELNFAQIAAKVWRLRGGLRNRSRRDTPVPIEGMRSMSFVDSPDMSRGETPSAGAKCSARGLAKLAAVMANGGRLGEHTLIGEAGHQAMHHEPVQRNMSSLNTSFTQAGLALFSAPAPSATRIDKGLHAGREGFYGWMGLGGSIFQWHPELKIGFAYVPTSLNVLDIVNERGKAYQAEAVRCARAAFT